MQKTANSSTQTRQNTVVQTGPKTEDGKKVSSKNAQQYGIFTKGYLAFEDHEQLDQQYYALCKQWGATDPTRQIMVRGMHQVALSANRLALAQQQMIDAAMQSPNVRAQFAELAQMDAITGHNLPSWFFQEPEHPEKAKAIFVAEVWDEASELKAYYSDRLVAEVQTRYPNLHRYVMQSEKVGTSFTMAMGQRYKQNIPAQNLAILMNEITEKYRYHLIWAQDPQRYEIYVSGIRGQQICAGMDLDKTLRYTTAFQNQFAKGCQALDAMNRLEGKGMYAPALNQSSALTVRPIETLQAASTDLLEEVPSEKQAGDLQKNVVTSNAK